MVNTDPAKPLTTTDRGEILPSIAWAHAALIAVALTVALPSPFAKLWGGNVSGSPSPALLAAFIWSAFTYLGHRRSRAGTIPEARRRAWSIALLLGDVVGLSFLLSLSGAAQNPFTMLYFVPITLATFVARRWTFRVAALSVASFGLLLLQTADTLRPHLNHAHHSHFFQHVQGMAIALAIAGVFVTLFVHRIAHALEAQKRRITELSQARQDERFAVALGTLAAGAAHELGSPLGTVQLLSDDLQEMEEEEREEAVATIVSEVQRMKRIVHQMGTSELSAEVLGKNEAWRPASLVQEFPSLSFQGKEDATSTQPREVLTQIIRELLRNASRVASESGVELSLSCDAQELRVLVSDDGPGLTPEVCARATSPFVSETGGTGLGLFLASMHAKQLGGSFRLESQSAVGTQAILTLPLHPPIELIMPSSESTQ